MTKLPRSAEMARLQEAGERQRRAAVFCAVNAVLPGMRPHRPVDAVARPDRAVGEADLAPDRPPALGAAAILDEREYVVGLSDTEVGPRGGERVDLSCRVESRDEAAGGGVEVGGHGLARWWSGCQSVVSCHRVQYVASLRYSQQPDATKVNLRPQIRWAHLVCDSCHPLAGHSS